MGSAHGGADIISKRIRLPAHMGGLGVRSVAAMSTPAFIAGACAAVPAFTGVREPKAVGPAVNNSGSDSCCGSSSSSSY